MQEFKFKKILFIFLLIIFLFQASSVFALEIKYPPLPGAETPNQIQEKISKGIISEQDSLPLYINYFLRLFFVIAISIAITIIIYGGVLYLISGAKPAVLVTAKNWMSRGFLGLLIIVCSYLILAVINPQLLVFKVEQPGVLPLPLIPVSIPAEKVIVQQVPLAYLFEEALEDIGETTNTEWGTIHRIEVPLYRVGKTLEELSATTTELINLLSLCKCGDSKFHEEVEWSLSKGGKCKCVGGVKKEDREGEKDGDIDTQIKGYEDLAASGTQAITDAGETMKSLSMKVAGLDRQQRCLMNCEDCGTSNECQSNLEKIKKKDGKRDGLTKLLAELQASKPLFASEQIDLIKRTLYQGAANFLAQHTIEPTFQEDFVYQKKSYEGMGKEVEIIPFRGIESIPLTELSPAITDPLTINIITYGSGNPAFDRENQKLVNESNDANLFYVLATIMRQEVQAAIQDCLTRAFGNVETEGLFTGDEFLKIITQAIQEGLGGSLSSYLEKQNAKITGEMTKTMNEEVGKSIEEKATASSTCATTTCKGFTPKTSEYESCMKKCLKPPPHFLSDLTAKLLTEKVEERLTPGIRDVLNKSVEDAIFSPELQTKYKEAFIDKLDKLLGGALTKTLTEQFPQLKEWLDKRLATYLPEYLQASLNSLDFWLAGKLKYIKKGVYADVEKYTAELMAALTNPLVGAVESYREGRFTAARYNDDKKGCETAGYIYQEEECSNPEAYNNEQVCSELGGIWTPAECKEPFRPTAAEINDYYCGEPSEITDPLYCSEGCGFEWSDGKCHRREGQEDKRKAVCENQGYCWEWGECREECAWLHAKAPNLSWEDVAAGAINFLQEFIVALSDTATYTLTKYALVWVEDTILRPLQPYIQQISDFQEKLHNFLQITIKEALPQQIATYLQSSIVSIINDICRNPNQTTKIEHYSGYTEISPEDKEVLCNINKKLHESIRDQFSTSTRKFLESEIKSFLPADIKEVLDKTPAELFFPEIEHIKELVLGTPKQLICGDLIRTKNGEVVWQNGTLLHEQCEAMKANFGGIAVPVIDSNNSEFQKNTEFYGAVCPPIWMYCDAPAKLFDFNIGKFITQVITQSCEGIDNPLCNALIKESLAQTFFYQLIYTTHGSIEQRNKNEEKIDFQWLIALFDGKEKPLLKDDIYNVAIKREFSNEEWNQLYKEVEAYTDFGELPENIRKGAMLATSWFTEDKTLFEILTSPNLGVMRYFHPKEKEGKEYVYGPGKNFLARTPYELLHDDACGKIKWQFGIDYPNCTFESVRATVSAEINRRVSQAPPYTVERLERVTTAKIFNAIRKIEEAPLERKVSYLFCLSLDYKPAEILGLDQELMHYVYPPEYQIMFGLMKELLKPDEMPVMLNKLIDTLYNKKPIDILYGESRKLQQGRLQMGLNTCAMEGTEKEKENCCNNKPTQPLKDLCPVEDTDIKALCDSMPDKTRTPKEICLEGIELEKSGIDFQNLVYFLDTTIGNQIQNNQLYYWQTEIIVLIFDKLEENYGIKCEIAGNERGRNCLQKTLWQLLEKEEWQKMRDQIFEILNKTPVKLIEEYLNKNLLQLLSPEIQRALARAPIDYIADQEPILKERYVDTFGDWFGLTDNVYDAYLGAQKAGAVVDKTIAQGQAAIQGSFDKFFMEYPREVINWIGRGIAGIFGAKFGEKTADQMTGIGCKDASQEQINQKQCPGGWVFKPAIPEENQVDQCCNLGQGLVCEPKLKCKLENEGTELVKWRRIEPEEGETCRDNWETPIKKPVTVNIGTEEEPEIETVTTTYCCLTKCKRCRELKTEKCRDNEKQAKAGEASFCCYDLEEKDGNCCFSLMDCIAEKLTPILEQIIPDLYINGPQLNELPDVLEY